MANTKERMSIYGYTQALSDLSRKIFHAIGDIDDEATLDVVIEMLDTAHEKLEWVVKYLEGQSVNAED